MNFFDNFFKQLPKYKLDRYEQALKQAVADNYHPDNHGDWQDWIQVFEHLPSTSKLSYDIQADTISLNASPQPNKIEMQQLSQGLKLLHPWRKGPFNLFGLEIDTEWRSDWKWQRLAPHISPLKGKRVLDVGCGSGYHCWRMYGEGASLVLGIDPSLKFMLQFHIIKHYLNEAPVFYLPLKSEELPGNMNYFETVFSMGVLYHRKSPLDHLQELKQALKPGGELVLETLVVEGDKQTVFMPSDRYAQMRNVWFLPSSKALKLWLEKLGFIDVKIVDESDTTLDEQRQTQWMQFHSLIDFLDPGDQTKTVEGHPAPRRAILVATKA